MDSSQLSFAVAASTMVIVLICAAVVILLIFNNNRRIRHRAELAEADRLREQEVQRAEREATEHTMKELGRELHDNVGQLLSVAQLGVVHVLEEQGDREHLASALGALEQGIEEVRRLGRSLNSDQWHGRSFEDAVSLEAERIERAGVTTVHMLKEGVLPEFDAETKTILFRVFQELLNNALKHARSHTVAVTLSGSPGFRMMVRDEGPGFDAERASTGSGLVNIRKRCALIGFTAELRTTKGEGTTWTIAQKSGDA